MTAPAPLSGGDARTQLAEALNDVGLGCEEWSPADDNSGCPDCMDLMRRVDALLPTVERIADERAAEALEALAAEIEGDGVDVLARAMRRVDSADIATARAASLRAASRGETPKIHHPGVHKPFTDDGVTYCGHAGDGGIYEGCGYVWPCPAASRGEAGR